MFFNSNEEPGLLSGDQYSSLKIFYENKIFGKGVVLSLSWSGRRQMYLVVSEVSLLLNNSVIVKKSII